MANSKTVLFKIKRQSTPDAKAHWEEFELPWHSGMNVISSLMEIAANPVTRDGKATTPITYDSNCLEEVCGSCAMLINGRARMACSALVDKLEQPIRLEPFSKFPVVRDLAVDSLAAFPGEAALTGLLEALADTSPRVRATAAAGSPSSTFSNVCWSMRPFSQRSSSPSALARASQSPSIV